MPDRVLEPPPHTVPAVFTRALLDWLPWLEPLAVERLYLDNYFSVAKASRDLGYQPLFSIERALAECLPYYVALFQRMKNEVSEANADARPPAEPGPFRKPDLVDLTAVVPGIKLDIRYASTNNFLGVPCYSSARALIQRPAAHSLARVQAELAPLGYGLLIHDAYRPWRVTKMFWEATPEKDRIFVADPSKGSRHNRGSAVDLTLYDRKTGNVIAMVGGFDEMSDRSYPDYQGGTSLQRWHRDLLRRAMESEGFTVYEHEWWHFDYKDWHEYPILNIKFEDLHSGQGLASAQ